MTATTGAPRVVVVGNGMVGHRLVERLLELPDERRPVITVFGEERRLAYDRVGLTRYLTGATADELSLVAPGAYDDVTVHLGDPVLSVDLEARTVRAESGTAVGYDALVLATGSAPFVPPVPGADTPGCFVYRTLDDLDAIRDAATGRRVGAVVGGGLLGLEAAQALLGLGLETHVVEFAPRLMPAQVDDHGAIALRDRIEDLGVHVHAETQTSGIHAGADGRVTCMTFGDGTALAVDLVVFSAGIRPRDELARAMGLTVGERGGVVVDEACRTSDPHVYAIGECAEAAGRTWGLVAPGYEMARVVADRIGGGDASFVGGDLSTKLKVLGVEVASFGDAFGTTPGARDLVVRDDVGRVYQRLVLDSAGTRVLGGILVGDTSRYPVLQSMARGEVPAPPDPITLLAPAAPGTPVGTGVEALPAAASICSCNSVTKGALCAAIAEGYRDPAALQAATGAGSTCGGCRPLVSELVDADRRARGEDVRTALCEHFDHSRADLYEIVRVTGITSFAELVAAHGTGHGCEICKPVVASILASQGGGYILGEGQAALQDTNDHFLANLQRDGTYSVVPRVPGGEITPAQLIVIGEIARDFGLYTKITGGQRIDLFGARVEQLPEIWERLVAVGMESGHAYGKALRTVKSCVGRTWCRYGVQDSTAMAIRLELRYRGLRAPHKVKAAVSGCARECAEAQSKDFGVIATEDGWNLYVGGNGGMRPRHADLLATAVDDETLVRLIDRFLVFYLRTADRLQRTATWIEHLDGGIDHLRAVVVDDSLGVAEELEAEMDRLVTTYECEWAATLADPARRARFRTYVNDPTPDPGIVMVSERGQPRPARPDERSRPPAVPVRLRTEVGAR